MDQVYSIITKEQALRITSEFAVTGGSVGGAVEAISCLHLFSHPHDRI